MPVYSGPIAPRLRKPGDLRHPVADRDQKHLTVSAAPQANTRDLAQWHVYHAAYSQLVLVRLSFSHGKGSLRTSSRYNHCLMISRVFCSSQFEWHVRFGSKADIGARPRNVRFTPKSGHSPVRPEGDDIGTFAKHFWGTTTTPET